jgi:hypothetical protein
VRRRIPWWAAAAVAAVVGVTVAGNFATGFRGRYEPATTTVPAPPLADQVRAAAVVVVGRVTAVTRVGRPSDPGVLARIAVERVVAGDGPRGSIEVFDRGFAVSWQEGERGLYFLRPGGEAGASLRVAWRYLYRDGRLDAPFTLGEVLAAAARRPAGP